MNDFAPSREVARVIWFLKQKQNGDRGIVRTMQIIDLCNEHAGISSYSPHPDGALKFLEKIGIVNKVGIHLRLSTKCIELVRAAENPLNLNEEQKETLYAALLSHKEIGQIIRNLFTTFNPTENGVPAISSDSIRGADAKTKQIMYILQELDVLYWDGFRFQLNKDKLKFIDSNELRIIALDESTLEKILLFQKKVAKAAEDFVVEWEKHRLEFQGDIPLIKLVRRVGGENVNLGYDIASVEGGKNGDTDRFIEVKSSCGSSFSFYWSSNEIECARRLGKKYWLYFVPRANILPLKKPCMQIIRNPISCLGKTLKYTEKILQVWHEPSKKRGMRVIDFGDGWCGMYF